MHLVRRQVTDRHRVVERLCARLQTEWNQCVSERTPAIHQDSEGMKEVCDFTKFGAQDGGSIKPTTNWSGRL